MAPFATDVEGARVAAGYAGQQAMAVDGFDAGENIGMASMPLSFAAAGDGEAV
jgi:hypothetical protein